MPFSSGEKRGRLFRSFPEDRKELEDLLQIFLENLGVTAPEIASEFQVFQNAQRIENLVGLWNLDEAESHDPIRPELPGFRLEKDPAPVG